MNRTCIIQTLFRIYFALMVFTLGTTADVLAAPIKSMSFNIRYDRGIPGGDDNAWIVSNGSLAPNRRDLVLNVVNHYDPDILGVQEARPNQVNDLLNGLPQHDFYGVGRDGGTSGEYSGIFYRSDRFTRIDEGTFWLSWTPDEPSYYPGTNHRRIASWAILEDNQADDQEYFVLNTHWDHQVVAARLFSALLIRDRINLLSGDRPLIVMGDLNNFETGGAYRSLIGDFDPGGFQLLDSYREVVPIQDSEERTFHGFNGGTTGSRIDYVLHSDDFLTVDASIVRTDFDGYFPSDHYPVTAMLQTPQVIPEPSTTALILAAALFFVGRRRP